MAHQYMQSEPITHPPEETLHTDHHTPPRVLVIGTDSHVLIDGSEHRARMVRYASVMRELHILVLGAASAGQERTEIAPHVFVYPTRTRTRAGAVLAGIRIARRIVREHSVDVISTQDPFECALVGYLARRRSRAALQIQEHGDFFSAPYWHVERVLHRVRYPLGRFLTSRADCLRVVSERIKRGFIARGFPAERIAVAPLATDVSAFMSAAPDHGLVHLRPEGGVLVLTMARFVPQKNLCLLLRAFGRIVARGTNARLVVLGQGPEKGRLLRAARDLMPDRITFLDWTEDPAAAMHAADIYVLSSDYEGWGRVAIEALAAGTPLVMTDVGCAGEVVHDGENGLVVPVRDEVALAAALTRLAQDPALRARVAEEGRRTVARLPKGADDLARYAESFACCTVAGGDRPRR